MSEWSEVEFFKNVYFKFSQTAFIRSVPLTLKYDATQRTASFE